jgi:hypothetical protein
MKCEEVQIFRSDNKKSKLHSVMYYEQTDSGNSCYFSLQKLLSSHLLSKTWGRLIIDNLIFSRIVKKFPAFYKTRSCITVFTEPAIGHYPEPH